MFSAPDRLVAARQALGGACTRDHARLHGLLRRWQAQPGDAAARAAFADVLSQSLARREARAATLPQAAVDPSLPIAAEAERIVALIREHQVLVIAGEPLGQGHHYEAVPGGITRRAGMIAAPARESPRGAGGARVSEELQVPLAARRLPGSLQRQRRRRHPIKFMTTASCSPNRRTAATAYDTISVTMPLAPSHRFLPAI